MNKKITPELKQSMLGMREKGLSARAIGKILMISGSTVMYHTSDEYRLKQNERCKKNKKVWSGKKEYIKNYMKDRYANDEEFRERVRKHSRESWRRRNKLKLNFGRL